MKTVAIIAIIALTLVGPAFGAGAKTHGDACNFIASGIQIFSDNNYAEACNTDKGLACAINTCSCLPSYHWEQNFFENLFGAGGTCVRDGPNGASGLKALGVFATAVTALFVQRL